MTYMLLNQKKLWLPSLASSRDLVTVTGSVANIYYYDISLYVYIYYDITHLVVLY